MSILCPYCNAVAERTTGARIHPKRTDLAEKVFYMCRPCRAWVGCHPNTTRPLGRLANHELRRAKQAAHTSLDFLWNTGTMSRKEAYQWLAGAMNIPSKGCHIGMFDVAQCEKVVESVEEFLRNL